MCRGLPALLAAALTAEKPGISGPLTGSTMMSESSAFPTCCASPRRIPDTCRKQQLHFTGFLFLLPQVCLSTFRPVKQSDSITFPKEHHSRILKHTSPIRERERDSAHAGAFSAKQEKPSNFSRVSPPSPQKRSACATETVTPPLHKGVRSLLDQISPRDSGSAREVRIRSAHQRSALAAIRDAGAHWHQLGQRRAHLLCGRLKLWVHQHKVQITRKRQLLDVQRLTAPIYCEPLRHSPSLCARRSADF